MSRHNAGSEQAQGRRMLRLMLAFTVTAAPLPVAAQTDWNPIQGAQSSSKQPMDMPAYPLLSPGCNEPVSNNFSQLEQAPSNRTVRRWLGLNSHLVGGVGPVTKFSTVESMPIAGDSSSRSARMEDCLPELTQVVPAIAMPAIAQSELCQSSCPPNPRLETPSLATTENRNNSPVVVASATEPQKESVAERLSDIDSSSLEGESSIDPLDLMNSLDLDLPQEPPEPGKISENPLTESEPVVVQFADAAVQPIPVIENTVVENAARQPQLVRPNQGLTVKLPAGGGQRPSRIEAQRPEELDGIVTSPSLEPSELSSTADMTGLQPMEVSSRRRPQPKAMNIQIEGEPMTPLSSIARPPLVNLLSEVPKASPSSEDPQLTLKQLIYSETDSGRVVGFAASGDSVESMVDGGKGSSAGNMSAQEIGSDASTAVYNPELPTKIVESNESVRVGVKKSINLKSSQLVQAVSAEHEDICQIIQTGQKSFTVIGLTEGVTRVALISELDGERQIEVRQVTVSKGATAGSDLSVIAESISQTVQQLYPSSSVQVITRGQQLVVHGRVDSEASARKILSLVRKTALVPVVDELKTY